MSVRPGRNTRRSTWPAIPGSRCDARAGRSSSPQPLRRAPARPALERLAELHPSELVAHPNHPSRSSGHRCPLVPARPTRRAVDTGIGGVGARTTGAGTRHRPGLQPGRCFDLTVSVPGVSTTTGWPDRRRRGGDGRRQRHEGDCHTVGRRGPAVRRTPAAAPHPWPRSAPTRSRASSPVIDICSAIMAAMTGAANDVPSTSALPFNVCRPCSNATPSRGASATPRRAPTRRPSRRSSRTRPWVRYAPVADHGLPSESTVVSRAPTASTDSNAAGYVSRDVSSLPAEATMQQPVWQDRVEPIRDLDDGT